MTSTEIRTCLTEDCDITRRAARALEDAGLLRGGVQ